MKILIAPDKTALEHVLERINIVKIIDLFNPESVLNGLSCGNNFVRTIVRMSVQRGCKTCDKLKINLNEIALIWFYVFSSHRGLELRDSDLILDSWKSRKSSKSDQIVTWLIFDTWLVHMSYTLIHHDHFGLIWIRDWD